MSKVLALIIAFILILTPTVAMAQSRVTQEVKPGEVVIKNESDGTVYLTTEVARSTDSATTSPTRTTTRNSNIRGPLAGMNVVLPDGFADSFNSLFNGILSFVLVIAALLVFLYLILGAFEWITSGGDKGKTDKARQKIIAAIIGLIIIASSYAILTLVLRFLGFNDINAVFDSAGTIRGVPPSPTPSPLNTLESLNATPSGVLK